MPDHFEYIECWTDDTIGKPPWGNSCPGGQSCKEKDVGVGVGVGPSKKGLSNDAKLTVILCCTLIPVVIGIGVLVHKHVNGGWGNVAMRAGTSIRRIFPAKFGGT